LRDTKLPNPGKKKYEIEIPLEGYWVCFRLKVSG
jgi:hypothetical protein